MNTSKSKVNNVMGEPTPQRAKASHVSPRKLRKILRAVDRAARAWERRGARFFPHPRATLAPDLPRSAWATAAAGFGWPMSRHGEVFTVPTSTAEGGRPMLGLSRPDAIVHMAATVTRHWNPTLANARRAARSAASVIEAMDAEVAR